VLNGKPASIGVKERDDGKENTTMKAVTAILRVSAR
jgi:hypothetical protein